MSEDQTQPTVSSVTSTYLLEGLKDPANQTVWQQYVDRYRPLILRYARRLGLDEVDGEDAAQQALLAFCEAYRQGRYERGKGRLRDWLFGIARNQIRNYQRRQHGREVQVATPPEQTDFFVHQADEKEWEDIWEQEWRDAVLRQCLEEARREVGEKTFAAFELFASQGWPARKVAEHLGLTANAVFIAKHRILRRVRELLPTMEEVW